MTDDGCSPIAKIVVVCSPEGREDYFFLAADNTWLDPDIDYCDNDREFKEKYGIDVKLVD